MQDGGDPILYDTATVSIFVNRNLQRPNFLPDNQRVVIRIPESALVGYPIFNLTAEDTDQYVSLLI